MNASIMVADSGKLDGQNRAKIRQIEAKKAEKTRLVVDVSNTIPLPVIHGKYGVSFVIDLVNGKIEIYPHAGGYIGNASGLSLSMGLVSNYDGDNSYAGTFIDANAGWIIGIDHCYSPDKPYQETVKATSLTIAIPTSVEAFGNLSKPSAAVGSDWYFDAFTIDLYN